MKITLCEIPLNNHGCSGEWLELEVLNNNEAVVISGGSCNSCWQVGHDRNEPRFKVGTKVCLPETLRDTKLWHHQGTHQDIDSGERYYDSKDVPIAWHTAKRMCGYSHNELVYDSENPQPDTTLVRPSDLIISLSNF